MSVDVFGHTLSFMPDNFLDESLVNGGSNESKKKEKNEQEETGTDIYCGDGITGDRCEHRSDTLCHAR